MRICTAWLLTLVLGASLVAAEEPAYLSGSVSLAAAPAPAKKRISRGSRYRQRSSVTDATANAAATTVSPHPLSFAARLDPQAEPGQIEQREVAFKPRVLAITKGSTVQFINRDKIFHNVFTLTEGAKFDIGRRKTGVVVQECDNYWIAALLHDIGKLILGFFFWNYFEKVVDQMEGPHRSFRDAETRMGDTATHEQVGELLLIRTNMAQELVSAVANHSDPDPLPRLLVSLVHLGDQLCKDLGLGYVSGERGEYSDSVLRALNLDRDGLNQLREGLRKNMVDEIMDVVDRCTAA